MPSVRKCISRKRTWACEKGNRVLGSVMRERRCSSASADPGKAGSCRNLHLAVGGWELRVASLATASRREFPRFTAYWRSAMG